MVKIRLARGGTKHRPFYQIVVTDVRNPRDGRFIERIGFFNPISMNQQENLKLNIERINYWIQNGAQLSKRVASLIQKFKKII